VASGDRIRLFCALRLPAEAIERLVAWQAGLSGGRVVPPHNLHVTLAFLGYTESGRLSEVVDALRTSAAGAGDIALASARYRETRSVAMLELDDLGGGATALAEDVHGRLERLGVYRREARVWLPHVTVARFQERPRLRVESPALGTFVPSDAAVYLSRLRPSGAQYDVLESVALGR
jgi:2'-5' RNA ligase